MKKVLWIILVFTGVIGLKAEKWPEKKTIVERMTLVNDRFMRKWPVAGDTIRSPKIYPSNIWTRSVYMEGLMALNETSPNRQYVQYATDWAVSNMWGFREGSHTRNADNQCCAQIYADLYRLHGDAQVLGNTERMLNNIVNSTNRKDWTWVDALQMAMPLYAKMGNIKHDIRYFRTMTELYRYTRNKAGQVGLFNSIDGLWWRDSTFIPPYKEPNGKNCYWSRGNGWALAALARTLDETVRADTLFENGEKLEIERLRKMLADDFVAMALAIKKYQRQDGFWNCSLTDELHYGGRETTGTSLFVYGIAWGIRRHLLSPEVFAPVVIRAWNAQARDAVHPDGFLGYVQGTGKEPKDGQPVGYDSQPDFEDFGIGCFLLAGSEMAKLSRK
ncbi:MAG: glycoside hydrolase family 88 protein [Paraprevotella sp.]|nr:glycoside hydrolase family 88 protein [Paraprevotella sp.]